MYGTVDVAWIRCGKVQFTLDLREGESSGGGTGWGLDSLSDIFCLLCVSNSLIGISKVFGYI